jgi:4-amino-4-deoxy-L-arabinose transferase-like glycosyltransferase
MFRPTILRTELLAADAAVGQRIGWNPLLLALGTLLLCLAGATGYDLLTDDEARYAEAGRQMLAGGDWIVPTYNGVPRYQKPILYYWLQAASQSVFGTNAFAARVPTALAAAGVVFLVVLLGQRLWGRAAGLWAGLVLASSVQFVLLARLAMIDMVLLFFLQGAITCCLFLYLRREDQPSRALAWAFWTCLALGMLAKGPVVLLLAGLALTPLTHRCIGWRNALNRLRPLAGLLICAAILGPFLALAWVRTDGQYLREFLLTENLGRFGTVINGHVQPAWFLPLLLVPLTFPWTGLLPQALVAGWREGRLRGLTPPAQQGLIAALPRALIVYILLVLVFFTCSRTRVWTYTLPVLPAFALLLGRHLADRLAQDGSAKMLRLPLWLGVAAAATSLAVLALLPVSVLPAEVRTPALLRDVRLGVAALLTALIACLAAAHVLRLRGALASLVAATALWYALLFGVLVPRFDRHWNGPVRDFAQAVRVQPDAPVVSYFVHELGLNYQAGVGEVVHLRRGRRDELERLLRQPRPVLVMVHPEHVHALQGLPFHEWGRHARFVWGGNFARQ